MSEQQQQGIAYQDTLSKFDGAIADSHISWAPTAPIHSTDDGFRFQFRLCPQFLYKPQLSDVETQDPTTSDIPRPPSLHIASVPPSHTLDLNAYPVLRPSYLLLTNSPTHQQSSPLNVSDVHAAWMTLDRLERDSHGKKHMMIYNCGREAGCSRSHKHMQLFPCPPDFELFPDRTPDEGLNVPYVYELVRLGPSSLGADDTIRSIFTAYRSCLQRARAVLGIEEGEHVPHNVVLVREWILVIPRRKARLGGVSANAACMMGLVWVSSEKELEEWRRRGGWNILGELGVGVGRGHYQHKADDFESLSRLQS